MLLSEVQPSKAPSPIPSTDSGIIMLLSEVQPSKAPSPIHSTDSGIIMLLSDEQPSKAPSPIFFTDSGIIMLLSDEQPSKALSPIFVTDSGIIVDLQPKIRVFVFVSIMALQPSRESYTGLSSATTILSSDAQLVKAYHPILATESGRVMLSSEVQPSKA